MIYRTLGTYHRVVWILSLLYGALIVSVSAWFMLTAGQASDWVEVVSLVVAILSVIGLWFGSRLAAIGFALIALGVAWSAFIGVSLAMAFGGQSPNYVGLVILVIVACLPPIWAWQIGGARKRTFPMDTQAPLPPMKLSS